MIFRKKKKSKNKNNKRIRLRKKYHKNNHHTSNHNEMNEFNPLWGGGNQREGVTVFFKQLMNKKIKIFNKKREE